MNDMYKNGEIKVQRVYSGSFKNSGLEVYWLDDPIWAFHHNLVGDWIVGNVPDESGEILFVSDGSNVVHICHSGDFANWLGNGWRKLCRN